MRPLFSGEPGWPADEREDRPQRLIQLLRGLDAGDLEVFAGSGSQAGTWEPEERRLKAEIGKGRLMGVSGRYARCSFAGCLFERFGGPLVETCSLGLGGHYRSTVDLRRYSEQ